MNPNRKYGSHDIRQNPFFSFHLYSVSSFLPYGRGDEMLFSEKNRRKLSHTHFRLIFFPLWRRNKTAIRRKEGKILKYRQSKELIYMIWESHYTQWHPDPPASSSCFFLFQNRCSDAGRRKGKEWNAEGWELPFSQKMLFIIICYCYYW